MQEACYLIYPLPRKKEIEQKGDDNADARVQHTIQGIGDIGVYGSVEQDDAKDDTTRLDGAGPAEKQADQNHEDDAHKQKNQHQRMSLSVRTKDDIEPEEPHTEEAANDRAEESVSAVELGIVHIASRAENGTDAGEGRIPAKGEV